MLPEIVPSKWRRLWRRRLRRRPLLPWLALAVVAFSAALIFEMKRNDGQLILRVVVLGLGVALLGLAALWITHSPRLIWLRLAVVMLTLIVLLALATPRFIGAADDRRAFWASGVVLSLLVVGATALLGRFRTIAVVGVRYGVRWIGARLTCPHCGKPYAAAAPPRSELRGRRFRLTIRGILGFTTAAAVLATLGANMELSRVYGGLREALDFLAMCTIVPVVAVSQRVSSLPWRIVATTAIVLAVSSLISFPRNFLEAVAFCAAIGVGAQVGLWLSHARRSGGSTMKAPKRLDGLTTQSLPS